MEIKLYKCRAYLFCLYILCEMTPKKIGEMCEISHATISRWLKKFNIPIRSYREANKIAWSNPEVRAKISGENNYGWKEWNELGYGIKHIRMHKKLKKMGIDKPEYCPICSMKPKTKKQMHLMNIDHKYRDMPNEWFYMCSKCHIKKYDFLAGLLKGHRIIKPISNLIEGLLGLETREEREQLLKEVILGIK